MSIRFFLAVLVGITVAVLVRAQTYNHDVTLRTGYREGV
jgi:hypothetical protein